jgi:hypothetical protein
MFEITVFDVIDEGAALPSFLKDLLEFKAFDSCITKTGNTAMKYKEILCQKHEISRNT